MALNSRFRLSANDLFLPSKSAMLTYNFTTTPYVVVSRVQPEANWKMSSILQSTMTNGGNLSSKTIKSTKLHPLASSDKNEMVTTELKGVLFDLFDQLGQTKSGY